MKEKFARYLHLLLKGAMQVLRLHPVESALIVLCTAGGLLTYELEWKHAVPRLAVMALFAVGALAVNVLAGRGVWRKVYWVCWVPLIPLLFWNGLETWIESGRFALTAGVLLPLCILLCRRAARNDRFVCDAIVWLRSAVLAFVFAHVAFGLFCAILYSTTYIFGLHGWWINHLTMDVTILTEALAVPVLFLIMYDRWGGSECRGNRIVEVLLNYIVTPALLIYTVILYLYICKIAFTWSLPRGGVAYMVFGFMLLSMGVQALQFLLQRRIYDWFFNRFALISLPALALFWAGVVRRTGEYGLTSERIYLLVCGGLMTLCMLLFLSRRGGRYLYVCLAALIVFGAMTFIPALYPERIAVRSQSQRAERIAAQLGLLDADGRIMPEQIDEADSVHRDQLRQCYGALDYIDGRDSAAFARFGLKNAGQFTNNMSSALKNYVKYGFEYDAGSSHNDSHASLFAEEGCKVELGGCRVLYTNISRNDDARYPHYSIDEGITVDFGGERPAFRISGDSLLLYQFRKAGLDKGCSVLALEKAAPELLSYADGDLAILFSDMQLERRDSVWGFNNAQIDLILLK